MELAEAFIQSDLLVRLKEAQYHCVELQHIYAMTSLSFLFDYFLLFISFCHHLLIFFIKEISNLTAKPLYPELNVKGHLNPSGSGSR